ncbi:MAG TPA: ATP-binding protein [Geobacteraceae bacterium]
MEQSLIRQLPVEGVLDKRLLEQLAFNEKMAELGKLAAGLVHELNTPLSVIASAAQLILREQELPEFIREMVERIGEEAQRLSQLSKGVLTFSRQEQAAAGETDINELLREVLLFLRYEAQKRSIGVVCELDYELPPAAAEQNYLKQVFINLIMNALQAMQSGGTLLIGTSRQLDLLTIQVADTGCGIPADKLPFIFEPFFSTKEPGEGTGLGLYITRQIVEECQGKIAVESRPGEGTTFTVSLPLVGG